MSQTFVPSASAFHSEVAQCPDTLSVGVVLQRAVEPIGFTASAAGAFVPARRGAQSVFFFQNWPTDWLELYQRENFVNHDFTVAEARTVIAPFFWSEVLARRKLTLREQRVIDMAFDRGWTDGFNVPFHGPGGYFGLLVLAGHPSSLSIELRQHLILLALSAHERCRALTPGLSVLELEAKLTSRELECLRWVAAGLSDAQTGKQLGLSSRTVKDYLDNARRKIDAQTRAQAIAILASVGLI